MPCPLVSDMFGGTCPRGGDLEHGVETLSSWPVPFALLFLCLQRGGAGRLIIRLTSEEGWQLAVGEQDGMSSHKPLVMGLERPP